MKRTFFCAVLMFLPAVAHADEVAITDIDLRNAGDDVEIALRATGTLRSPRFRASAGEVRFWFPGVTGHSHLDLRVDGGAIRSVHVRPGAEDTAVLLIKLADSRVLDPTAVEAMTSSEHARIRIARSALPSVPLPAPAAPAETASAEAPAPAAAPVPTASSAQPTAAAPTPAAGPVVPADRAGSPQPAAQSEPARAQTAAGPARANEPLPVRRTQRALAMTAPSGPGMGLLLACTFGLGGAYLALRTWNKRRNGGKGPRAAIEVVASRRLGPRHQLVMVRAFGRDHLLSINGGATQRIASAKSPGADQETELDEPGVTASEEPEAVKPLGGRLALLRKELQTDHEDVQFGSELLRLAASRKDRAMPSSESVSGLIRLRQQVSK